RHQRREKVESRRNTYCPQGTRGKANRYVSRIHRDDSARGAETGVDERSESRLRQGQGGVRGEGIGRSQSSTGQQHLRACRASGYSTEVQVANALGSRAGVERAERSE